MRNLEFAVKMAPKEWTRRHGSKYKNLMIIELGTAYLNAKILCNLL